jgi:hypothetical protein
VDSNVVVKDVLQAIAKKTGFRLTCRIWVESRQDYIFFEQHAIVRLPIAP